MTDKIDQLRWLAERILQLEKIGSIADADMKPYYQHEAQVGRDIMAALEGK